MSLRVQVEGTLSITDLEDGKVVSSIALDKAFPALSNINEASWIQRDIQSTDTNVTLDQNGATAVQGFAIYVKSGTGGIKIKTDTNPNAVLVTNGFLIFGNVSTVVISTDSVQPVSVRYVFFQ